MAHSDDGRNSSVNVFAIVFGILAGLLVILLLCGGIIAVFLLPTARLTARRMQCSNNLKQIVLALHNYEATYKSLPPAYTVDSDGNKLHSWRTLILPYLEQSQLYSSIDLSLPWDHPRNAFAFNLDIPCFKCPDSKLPTGFTTYLAIVESAAAFTGDTSTKFSDISDGLANTAMVYESDKADAVHWMDPSDGDIQAFVDAFAPRKAGSNSHAHLFGKNCAMCDGSVQFLELETSPNELRAMTTKANRDQP